MPQTRHDGPGDEQPDAQWHQLTGPTYAELGHRERIDWHYHDVQQLVYPSSGVLAISAAGGTWVVPPQRAVWISGGRQARAPGARPDADADAGLPADGPRRRPAADEPGRGGGQPAAAR